MEYGIIISDKIKNHQERISTSLADRYVLSFSKEMQELKKIIISGNLTFIVLMLIHNRIIDKSQNMQDLRLFVSKVAKHDYPVLLSGKIGLRKSAVARLIHDISKRSWELDKRKEDISLLTEYYCKKNNFKITEHAISKLILLVFSLEHCKKYYPFFLNRGLSKLKNHYSERLLTSIF